MSKTRTNGVLFDNATSQPVADPATPTTLTAVDATAATNSTPYGFSQTQADAIVTQLNDVITILQAQGFAH